MVILGIDPGYAIVGYGFIQYEKNRYRVLNFGAITTPAGMDFSQRLKEIYQGRQFEATVVGMDTHTLAASGCLARFVSDSGKNFINFNSAASDETYAKAMTTVDAEAQTALFKQCEQILAEEAANVYLQDPADFAVMQQNVDGFTFYPALYIMDLSTLTKNG